MRGVGKSKREKEKKREEGNFLNQSERCGVVSAVSAEKADLTLASRLNAGCSRPRTPKFPTVPRPHHRTADLDLLHLYEYFLALLHRNIPSSSHFIMNLSYISLALANKSLVINESNTLISSNSWKLLESQKKIPAMILPEERRSLQRRPTKPPRPLFPHPLALAPPQIPFSSL